VEVCENPTMGILGRALRGFGPQIIHLCPSMKRSLSVGVYLDFGTTSHATWSFSASPSGSGPASAAAAGEASYFSVTAVAKLLAEFAYGRDLRPLLIMDVPAPPVTSEAVMQMVLRNAFASEVFRTGNVSAVLATGLVDRTQQSFIEVIVRCLAERANLGDMVREIRQRPLTMFGQLNASETLASLLGPIGTALFAQHPIALIR